MYLPCVICAARTICFKVVPAGRQNNQEVTGLSLLINAHPGSKKYAQAMLLHNTHIYVLQHRWHHRQLTSTAPERMPVLSSLLYRSVLTMYPSLKLQMLEMCLGNALLNLSQMIGSTR